MKLSGGDQGCPLSYCIVMYSERRHDGLVRRINMLKLVKLLRSSAFKKQLFPRLKPYQVLQIKSDGRLNAVFRPYGTSCKAPDIE